MRKSILFMVLAIGMIATMQSQEVVTKLSQEIVKSRTRYVTKNLKKNGFGDVVIVSMESVERPSTQKEINKKIRSAEIRMDNAKTYRQISSAADGIVNPNEMTHVRFQVRFYNKNEPERERIVAVTTLMFKYKSIIK